MSEVAEIYKQPEFNHSGTTCKYALKRRLRPVRGGSLLSSAIWKSASENEVLTVELGNTHECRSCTEGCWDQMLLQICTM